LEENKRNGTRPKVEVLAIRGNEKQKLEESFSVSLHLGLFYTFWKSVNGKEEEWIKTTKPKSVAAVAKESPTERTWRGAA